MQNNKAFTLVEILVVVGLISILSSFVVFNLIGANNSAKDTKREMDVETLKGAVVQYQNDNQNLAPTQTTTCQIGLNCGELDSKLEPYLGELPTDPSSGTYYLYQSSADGTDCTITANLSNGQSYQYNCSNKLMSEITLINGDCGSDNEKTLTAAPTNLCNQGTASSIIGAGPWFWDCDSSNGGLSESCIAYSNGTFTCSVNNGVCGDGEVDIFKMYDPLGGHAELNTQSIYSYHVCCKGSSIANQCSGVYGIPVKLYSNTNAHVEKNTETNYTNNTCISKVGMNTVCNYANDCSTLGANYTCLASISGGSTSLHIGNCDTYTTKVCCGLEPL